MTDRVDRVFQALADPTRRNVLRRLTEHGSATPTELAAELPVTRQAVSKHLVALSDAGLVASERAGRETRYRATPAPMAEAVDWIADVGAGWDARLDGLRRYLERRA